MRGNLSEEDRDYIKEIREALEEGVLSPDDIVTIDDQMMTARAAILMENELTARTYGAHKKN